MIKRTFMRYLWTLALLALSAPSFAATCKISEYSLLALDDTGVQIPAAREPAIATQTITYTTSAQSTAFNASTRIVRIVCDAKAHFKFSTAGTNATANDPYVAADSAEYFGVPLGQSYLVDFYDGSS